MTTLPTDLTAGQSGHVAHHEMLNARCWSSDRDMDLRSRRERRSGHAAAHAVLRTALGVSQTTHVAEHNLLHASLNPGPREISNPGGYTSLSPGATTWATTINAGSAGAHYWFPSGTYTLGSATNVTPKSNMILKGELGAIIDGGGTKANAVVGGTATGVEIDNLQVTNFTGTGLSWNQSGGAGCYGVGGPPLRDRHEPDGGLPR